MTAETDGSGAVPRHIAIIMDGNGRWAKARGRPRAFGHKAGVKAVRRVVKAAGGLGVTHLTLYSFSTENWRRPPDEVEALFELLRGFVEADLERLASEGVRVHVIGRREGLGVDLLQIIEKAERRTVENDRFHLHIAFNYGGRDEIVRAARRALEVFASDPGALDEAGFARFLDTAGTPDPDLVIRTSGERRISNFLLWQAAYAEFVFVDTHWPDFDRAALESALEAYRARTRRFGGLGHG